jgi:hypothetical protein
MDETGLFYHMQADNSLATKQLEGRKQNKERITITICCNADGSDKLPLWIIDKSFRPRCFKNINIDNLDCKYHANKNAWMTQNVFKLWLTAFDRRMDGRKVILLLDNCSAHIKDADLEKFNIQLRNTTLLYLPPNTCRQTPPRKFSRVTLESFAHSRPITVVNSTTNCYQGLKATSQTRRRSTSLTASKTPSQPRSKMSSQRPSRTVSSIVNSAHMQLPPRKSNPPLN